MLLRVHGSHHVYGEAGHRASLSVPVHGSTPLERGLQQRLMKLAGIEEDTEG
jgi:predicted RNA binding protein YcfA (HicA-like mRNA interferase family)